MTDDLQAKIDLEAARIRAWQDFEVRQDIRSVGILDDRLIEGLASHLVRNRAVELQNDTRLLVEAAEDAVLAFKELGAYLRRHGHGSKLTDDRMAQCRAALAPFEKGEGT